MSTPCSCAVIAVRSSRERESGAALVHVTDDRGEWHAVRIGEHVYRQTLVAPSAAELEARAAEPARAELERAAAPLDPLKALALVVRELRGGEAAPAAAHAIADALATEAATAK